MGRLIVLCLCVLSLAISGCQIAKTNPEFVDRQIIGEVMMGTELPQNLRALCMEGGRLSGSENGHKAERFVADRCRAYGLENVRFDPFEMQSWQDRKTVVTILDDPPMVLEGAIALGNCLSTKPEGVSAEIVYVGKGREQDFAEASGKLAGKFVLTKEGGGLHRGQKMRIALEDGAVGVIQISALEEQARVGQCHREPHSEPGVVILGKDGPPLIERIEAGETLRANVIVEADCWESTPNNVIAEIPGTGPLADQIVIVCAHLDSWHLAEGAIDNGTGSVAILEAARALMEQDWQPNRTIRFIWFMGEEHGLHGSATYVEERMDELDSIVAVVNMDMPGAPRRVYTFGHPEVNDLLEQYVSDIPGYQLSEKIGEASWTGSDHYAFVKQGVFAMSFSGEIGPGVKYYHSYGDCYEEVDIRGTIQAASTLAVLIRRLADAPDGFSRRLDPEVLKADGDS